MPDPLDDLDLRLTDDQAQRLRRFAECAMKAAAAQTGRLDPTALAVVANLHDRAVLADALRAARGESASQEARDVLDGIRGVEALHLLDQAAVEGESRAEVAERLLAAQRRHRRLREGIERLAEEWEADADDARQRAATAKPIPRLDTQIRTTRRLARGLRALMNEDADHD